MTMPPEIAALYVLADRIEARAAARAARRPVPQDRAEFERFRRRDYDAAKRARLYREQAARELARHASAAPAAADPA